MAAISIIMPVYNSKDYIEKAVQSVLNQNFNDFELILVDDGSTDGSSEICDSYTNKDNRIIVIHKTNGGISSARNVGIATASGDYITFLDNDDEYVSTLLADNYRLAIQSQADFVKFGVNKIHINSSGICYKTELLGSKENCILNKSELGKIYLKYCKAAFLTYIWNGLYSRKFLTDNNIRFNNFYKVGYEDVEFNIELCKNVNRIAINSCAYYNYMQRANHSTSFKFDVNRLHSILKIWERERNLLKYLNISSEVIHDRLLSNYSGYLECLCMRTSTLSFKDKISYIKLYQSKVGKIPDDSYNLKGAISLFLYNHALFHILILLKSIYNKIKYSI